MDGPTPQEIVQEFRLYRKSYRETLGEFLAHYHKLYLDASVHGIMGAEGILHLVPLLPLEWRRWAASLVPEFVDRALIGGNLYGDCRGFIAVISNQYISYGTPPPGQHEIPQGYEALGILIEYEPPMNDVNFVPFVFEPDEPAPMVPAAESEPIVEPFSETFSLLFSPQGVDTGSYISPFATPIENSTPQYLQFETIADIIPDIPAPPLPPELPPVEHVPYSPLVQRGPALPDPSHPDFCRHIPVPNEDFIASGSRPAKEDSDDDKDDEDPAKKVTAGRGKIRRISLSSLSFPVTVSRPEHLDHSPSDKEEHSVGYATADDEMVAEGEGTNDDGIDEGMDDDEEELYENEEQELNGDDEEEDPSEADSE